MTINDLPEEIIIIIIKLLDVKSCYNLYNTSTRLRNIIRLGHAIKVCQFSMNTMASTISLKLNFFKDISAHLQHLNLSGVCDLNKTSLLTALKKLKRLETLDVSFTKIVITDLLGVEKTCPNLLNISINFVFTKSNTYHIPQDVVLKSQDLFKNFENVHFVGTHHNLLCSKLSLVILKYAKLDNLKFTITRCDDITYQYQNCNQMVHFKTFNIYILNWRLNGNSYDFLHGIPILSMLKENYEFVIISAFQLNLKLYVSPIFKDFFMKHFNMEANSIETIDYIHFDPQRNFAIMIWNREVTEFNHSFFAKLEKRLLPYLPYKFLPNSDVSIPINKDWYFTTPVLQLESTNDEPEKKKRRISQQCMDLDYDEIFAEKKKLQLSLFFNHKINFYVSLPTNCNYLKKLTFLSLYKVPRFSINFFKILFQSCDNLITLSIKSINCSMNLAYSLHLTNSLKNLRLVENQINFRVMFTYLSKCKTLENIHLLDDGSSHNNFPDSLSVFQNCRNLYNFFVYARMSDSVRLKTITMLSRSKTKAKRYCLNIEVCNGTHIGYCYDPFLDVFNIEPIKQNM